MDLEKLPASLNNMTYLQILNAGNNKLKSLPVLDKLTALKTIYIHSNNLESFTGVFVNSRKMEFISAGNNKLTELPPELANMSLKTLFVSLSFLSLFSVLTFMLISALFRNVQNNEIASLPIELKGIKTLVNLDLSQNDFDCSEIRATFSGTIFAEQCIQSQQKTEKDVPGLPLSYSGEPTHAPLDGYEIAAIVLAVLFVCLLIPCVVLYVVYRRRGIST